MSGKELGSFQSCKKWSPTKLARQGSSTTHSKGAEQACRLWPDSTKHLGLGDTVLMRQPEIPVGIQTSLEDPWLTLNRAPGPMGEVGCLHWSFLSALRALTACGEFWAEGNGVPVFVVVLIHCFRSVPVELHLCQVDTVYLRTGPNTFRQTQQVVHLQYLIRSVCLQSANKQRLRFSRGN